MAAQAAAANGNAPDYGEAVEVWLCDHLDLDHVDRQHADAIATEATPKIEAGTPVQIKGCQRWTSNGAAGRTRGRWRVWRGSLLHLLHDGGLYLLAIYDPETDPGAETFVGNYRRVEPADLADHARGSWYDGHRPTKGDCAKIRWSEVIDPDE